jgi:phospholipid/cholesterol/gamma-HCH transport system substrate-binding protein
MNDSRLELKVGLFVALGLALIALLILNFSRGLTLFRPTYKLRIVMPTTAGLKPAADVLMAGVPIGKVSDLELSPPDGKSVEVTVRLLSKYPIRKDALFHVDALGFLGDQYIEVSPPAATAVPASNAAGIFRDGDTVLMGEVPFNMQETARSTAGLLEQAKLTMQDLDRAITNVNRSILSGETLTNFSLALNNFQSLTAIAVKVAQGAADLLSSNSPPVAQAVTNFRAFSEKLNLVADDLDQVILTNRGDMSDTVKNLRDTSASFKQLASELETGQGLAGGLLKDPAMKAQVTLLLSNANATAAALDVFGSNLNQRGIWGMLWKPKPKERSPAAAP